MLWDCYVGNTFIMNTKAEGNIAMIVSKTFSGLNMNALKYLIPVWMAPLTGVTLRVGFAAIAFWIIGLFIKNEPKTTALQKFRMFLLGAIGITGFMATYLTGLKYTTPVASSIILALVPLWVYIVTLLFFSETLTFKKGAGLLIGLGGAMLCMVAKKDLSLASDPFLGNILTLISSFAYALYLIFEHQILKKVGIYTLLKWTFLGAASSSVVISFVSGWHAPVLDTPIHWLPLSILLFVLFFPTVLSYLLLPIGLKYLKTTVVSMYGYLIIAVATVVALITGQDKFDWFMVASIILLCVGLYLVESGEKDDEKKTTTLKS